MITVRQKASIVIRQPVEKVFAAYVDARFADTDAVSIQRHRVSPEGDIARGTTYWERRRSPQGYIYEYHYEITEYSPPSRISYRAEGRFAADQSEKRLTADVLARRSYDSHACTFEPTASGTKLTVEVGYSFSYAFEWLYRPVLLFRRGQREMQFEQAMFAFKNNLEKSAGLKVSRFHFRWRSSWAAWLTYALVVIVLWWVYAARAALGLSHGLTSVLIASLSFVLVFGFVLVLLIKVYFRER